MSSTLCWRPKYIEVRNLPCELKNILVERYGLGGQPMLFTKGQIMYFQGLEDAKVPGVRDIIDGINKYGEIELWLSY